MQQASLFDQAAGSEISMLAGVMPAVRARMSAVADKHPAGRKGLVDLINDVAGREGVALTPGGGKKITIDILNKWLQPGERGHAPLFVAILCFCKAAHDHSPMEAALRALGLVAITKEDLWFVKYGKTCHGLRELKKQKTDLEAGK